MLFLGSGHLDNLANLSYFWEKQTNKQTKKKQWDSESLIEFPEIVLRVNLDLVYPYSGHTLYAFIKQLYYHVFGKSTLKLGKLIPYVYF